MRSLKINFLVNVRVLICTLLVIVGGSAYAQLQVQEIGGFVDTDQAQEWMSNYEFENPNTVFGHLYGSNTIREILSQDGAKGLKVFIGMDESGVEKMVYYAANANGEQFGRAFDVSRPCPPLCGDDDRSEPSDMDVATIGEAIDTEVADQWIADFNATHPYKLQSALFGQKIISEMLNPDEVKGLFFAQALDAKGQPQLLVVSADQHGVLLMNQPIAGQARLVVGPVISASK